MTALQRQDGTIPSSRRVMEKVIYQDLFDSRVHLPPCHLLEDGYVVWVVLPSEVRHAIKSVKNRTTPGQDRIRPKHLRNHLPVLVNTLARLFTRYLFGCKVPEQWKISKTTAVQGGRPSRLWHLSPYLPARSSTTCLHE